MRLRCERCIKKVFSGTQITQLLIHSVRVSFFVYSLYFHFSFTYVFEEKLKTSLSLWFYLVSQLNYAGIYNSARIFVSHIVTFFF